MVILPHQDPTLETEIGRTLLHLMDRDFAEVGVALRLRSDSILKHWRERTKVALPTLDQLTLKEFENSIAVILNALAAALESQDIQLVRDMIEQSPEHGLDRFAQKIDPHTLLAEARMLRIVIILELREQMKRDLTADEAASFHELFDIIGEYSLLAMMDKRSDARDVQLQDKIRGLHRLADLGTLVAGVAHDAANLMLPLRSYLDCLMRADVPPQIHNQIQVVDMIVRQFQNTITNLRWLSVESQHRHPHEAIELGEWSEQMREFQRRMLPRNIELEYDVPNVLPKVSISSAALSQAVFNVVRNAQQAIAENQEKGRIVVRARSQPDRESHIPDRFVHLTIEDDGPGMPPAIRARALEPFFGTNPNGSGLGLALVNALVSNAGGAVEIHSPLPGHPTHNGSRGTQVVLQLKTA